MNRQRRALDDDDDVVDLTAIDDDEPIPDLGAGSLGGRTNPKASKIEDIFILSDDDFGSVRSLGAGDFDPFETRLAKRQRISDDSDLIAGGGRGRTARGPSTFAVEGTRVGPGVLQPAGPKKRNVPSDPIEFTSSPHLPASSNKCDAMSSDPFASSPRRAEKENIISLVDDDDSDDPFAISLKGTSKPMMPPKGARKREPDPGLLENSPQQAQKRNQGVKNSVGWDHISSSAPEASVREDQWGFETQSTRDVLARSRSGGTDLGDLVDFPFSSDDDNEDDEFPEIGGIRKSHLSSKTVSKAAAAPRISASKSSTSTFAFASKTKPTAEDKVAARQAEKLKKQQEKEEIKKQRRVEKEKAAALAEVNKLRTDKKVSTPEMIVDLPSSMNPSIRLQVEALLEDLNVRHYPYHSPVNNVVKWRRKVRARFNEDEGYWEPIPVERIEAEKHAMVLMPAAEFVELALGAKGSDLDAHVLRMQKHYEGDKLIYMIEGLTPWMRKNRNVRNRQFQSAVRNAGADAEANATSAAAAVAAADNVPPPSSQAPPGRRRKDPKPPPVYIDEDQVEDALLQLQVAHGVIIHHTAAPIETAQWVATFTQHISTIPYKRQRDAVNESTGFCMETGQVRTGDGPADTYVRMLQEVVRVTAPIAYGIAGQYPTVSHLVRGLEAEGPLALEAIRKSANKDGAFTDRTIGQAISRRIHKVFTRRDETSTDI
jgi:crossover junction endonuclease EME1